MFNQFKMLHIYEFMMTLQNAIKFYMFPRSLIFILLDNLQKMDSYGNVSVSKGD